MSKIRDTWLTDWLKRFNKTNTSFFEDPLEEYYRKRALEKLEHVPTQPRKDVYITTKALQKIKALVANTDTEIAWHGTMFKSSKGYIITDIIVPPQKVTGATTTSDDLEYASWLFNLPEKIFKNLRFHGHSHVNMYVSPSSTDLNYRADLTANIGDNFYLFMITNKKQNYSFALYEDGKTFTNIHLKEINNYTDWATQEINSKLSKNTPITYKYTTEGEVSFF